MDGDEGCDVLPAADEGRHGLTALRARHSTGTECGSENETLNVVPSLSLQVPPRPPAVSQSRTSGTTHNKTSALTASLSLSLKFFC